MKSFSDLLRRWTNAELAADLGVSHMAASAMRRHGRVSPLHWLPLIVASRRRFGGRLTLADVHALYCEHERARLKRVYGEDYFDKLAA